MKLSLVHGVSKTKVGGVLFIMFGVIGLLLGEMSFSQGASSIAGGLTIVGLRGVADKLLILISSLSIKK